MPLMIVRFNPALFAARIIFSQIGSMAALSCIEASSVRRRVAGHAPSMRVDGLVYERSVSHHRCSIALAKGKWRTITLPLPSSLVALHYSLCRSAHCTGATMMEPISAFSRYYSSISFPFSFVSIDFPVLHQVHNPDQRALLRHQQGLHTRRHEPQSAQVRHLQCCARACDNSRHSGGRGVGVHYLGLHVHSLSESTWRVSGHCWW